MGPPDQAFPVRCRWKTNSCGGKEVIGVVDIVVAITISSSAEGSVRTP
jgi:hypothetical protein